MKKLLGLLFCLLFSIGILSAQHLKKNGTPDRRYKESGSTYSSPSVTSKSYSTYSNTTKQKKSVTPSKSYKSNKSQYSQSSYSPPRSKSKTTNKYTVARDKNGKIKRSESPKHDFMKQTGYPKGRHGYVVDHIVPLKKGGCDCPANMQWQTIKAAKEKDKWE